MNRRGTAAAVVLVCWVGGIAALVRRELFRPNVERLAEAAVRVSPGAVFYAVMQGDRQVGFASSTIDTASSEITATDYLVANVPGAGTVHRLQARTAIHLSRGLRVRSFDIDVESDAAPVRATGRVDGDSILLLVISLGPGASKDTHQLRISGPILLPALVPLAVALGQEPKVGKVYLLPIFDPATMAPRDTRLGVRAESSFVVSDSSVFDATSGRWSGVQPDTLRAWRIATEGGSGFEGWIDEQGRVVRTTQHGLVLDRRPYEVAFENWRIENAANGTAATADPNVSEGTAIAAGKKPTRELSALRVLLSNADLKEFDVDGGRQSLHGDTLAVTRESGQSVARMVEGSADLRKWNSQRFSRLGPPMRQERSGPAAREIAALAVRIAAHGRDPDPVVIAERINRWVHDSLAKKMTAGVPDALEVVRTRSGDCNAHTQLYVALARAMAIPARPAAGLVFIDGKFYYHSWPEVFLRDWVAVDPTFGQFPADASHLRFVIGGLTKQAELVRLIGSLHISVLPSRSSRSSQ